ncbi:protocadherin-11 X-linked-like isoform X2 [Convolutriloba macropyga]|uniref:protocadherin-11 X-linked-like isoform X2 n=1 Tax=Convolutriloba macropyga TaxID=536237 RepID=UPI003F5245E1
MSRKRHFDIVVLTQVATILAAIIFQPITSQNNSPKVVVSLPENVAVGYKVTSLSALGISARSKDDIILSPAVPFEIAQEPSGQFFIVTGQPIDRENKDLCKLTRQNDFKCLVELDAVIMNDGTPSSHRVEIAVEDRNDNKPTFDETEIVIKIPENTDPSNSAFSIPYATDADSAQFAIQSYTLDPKDSSHFSLKVSERSDGVLIPKLLVDQELNFEDQSTYMLTIIARDPENEGSMDISVDIIDINDNAPVFEQSEQTVEILENDPIGKVVLKVEAKDEDSGKNGQVFYRFAEETLPEILEYFKINETSGEIVLVKSLKSQGGQILSVQIEARDGGEHPLADLITTEFVIKDVNDNKPTIVFNPRTSWEVDGQPIYFSEKEEPRMIGFFKVTDDDPGNSGKTRLDQINATDLFSLVKIGPDMYSFSTLKIFDREKQAAYWVQFEASDCADTSSGSSFEDIAKECKPLKTSEVFRFNVGDINDFIPQFEKFRYNYTIVEETEPRILDKIVVEDEDYGDNGTVKFSIHSLQHEKWFHIDPDTGVFKILRKLDREVLGSRVNVTVKAYDLGSPARMTYKVFEILLIDIDDNEPKFNQSSYTFTVIENCGIGHTVGQVVATDPDTDGCVIYHTSDSDKYKGIFEVGETTGIIRTLKDFDFETEEQKEFYFEVYAASCKKPEQEDLVRANIQLIDDNDNGPRILSPDPLQEFPIPWDANPSYFVFRIEATDIDFGRNAKLTYHIEDTDNIFGVDAERGEIFVKNHDIYQNRDRRVKIVIWATDNGPQPMLSLTQTNFIYLDGNDTLFNHTLQDQPRVPFLPKVPKFMIYAVCTIGAIVVLIIVIWLVLLIRLRSSRASLASSVKAQYSAVAGEAQIHRHNSAHHNQYTLNGTLGRSQSPLGGSMNSSNQGAFMKTYPSPDACVAMGGGGGDTISRGTPSPDDSSRNQGGTGTVASGGSLHSSQLSTFNERGGRLSPHPGGGGKYSTNSTLEGRGGIDGGGTIDRRRSHANPHQTNPYSGGGPGAPPMIHYPARSCHPLSPPTSAGTNTISSSAPMPVGSSPASPQIGYHYPPPGAPHPGFQSPYGEDLSAFQNRYAIGGGVGAPYDYSRHPPSSIPQSYDPQTPVRNNHATFHPNRSLSDGDHAMQNMYGTAGRNSNNNANANKHNKWTNNHIDDNSPQGRPAPGLLHIGKPPAPSSNVSPSSPMKQQKQPSPVNSTFSETDDISPEVPPRPRDPEHPKNLPNTASRPPGTQVLVPPLAGHERWNLPNDNSFRGPNNGTLNGGNRQVANQNLDAPDLCKDVKSSLERHTNGNSKHVIKGAKSADSSVHESRVAQV